MEAAIQMPPRGNRRPGGMGNYWMRDVHHETWKKNFEDHFVVIPQIESQAGVANVDAIVAHPLVTALGLGPYDLSADIGCCWTPMPRVPVRSENREERRRCSWQKGLGRHQHDRTSGQGLHLPLGRNGQ